MCRKLPVYAQPQNDCYGAIADMKYMWASDCLVPFSAPCDAIFSVAYGENRRSNPLRQMPRSAQSGPVNYWIKHFTMTSFQVPHLPLDQPMS
jgi:hypothetical protein